MKYILNTSYLKQKIGQLQLKRSYLAFKLNVTEKTISRWTTGKTIHIQTSNLEGLSQVLGCSPGDLIINYQETSLIKNLLEKDILTKLSPHGDFDLVEQIIENAIPVYMSSHLKAEVYLELANVKWRTQDYSQAKAYAIEALEIGSEMEDKSILFLANYHLGTIDSISGHSGALGFLKAAYDLRKYAKSPSKAAALCNNLGMHIREQGYPQKALPYIIEAYQIYKTEEQAYNSCIAVQALLALYIDLDDYTSFPALYQEGLDYAQMSGFKNGLISLNLYHLKYIMQTDGTITRMHLQALEDIRTYCDPYISDIVYEYYLRYRPNKVCEIYPFLIDKTKPVPFMEAMLHYMTYKYLGKEEDMKRCQQVLESIGCQNWLLQKRAHDN